MMSKMFLNTVGRNYILREHWNASIGYTIEDLTASQVANQSKWGLEICNEPHYFRTTKVLS
jgi:hypothetical protein